ncbi:MAG TPA: hypothetical protein VHB20_13675 [Verrucomicrobiae bacterium]|jgi:hypothetical protein|nr:hypothetical protein [Verrucomicrobiae bacterium]
MTSPEKFDYIAKSIDDASVNGWPLSELEDALNEVHGPNLGINASLHVVQKVRGRLEYLVKDRKAIEESSKIHIENAKIIRLTKCSLWVSAIAMVCAAIAAADVLIKWFFKN